MEICEKNNCTGCSACYNVCPKQCIEMVEDSLGILIPQIDEEKCIQCNACKRVCPENNQIAYKEPQKVYAAWSLDENVRKNSASGGVAYEIYQYIVSNDGIAIGTKFDENMELRYEMAITSDEIRYFQGSKYVQSIVGDIFSKIKSYLNRNKKIVFVGTPCQVSGLKSFLKNSDTSNLITVDLICHGVPPARYLEDYLKYIHIKDKIDNITFRGKNNWNFTGYKQNTVVYKKHNKEDLYYKAFLKGLFYRENCYRCKYARKERVADITLGDFWGIGKKEKFNYQIEDGVSLILVNTKKGDMLINSVKDKLFLKKRTLEEAMEENVQLNRPSLKNQQTESYRRKYLEKGFKDAIEQAMKEE